MKALSPNIVKLKVSASSTHEFWGDIIQSIQVGVGQNGRDRDGKGKLRKSERVGEGSTSNYTREKDSDRKKSGVTKNCQRPKCIS